MTAFRSIAERLIGSVAALVLALVAASVLILAASLGSPTGFDPLLPLQAYGDLAVGAFGSPSALATTIMTAAPITLGALGVAVALRAGLFNVGVAGQFLVGAFVAGVTGAVLADVSPPLAVSCALAAGAIGGMVYGALPGVLKAFTGAHEVVVTIMLNSVASLLLAWLVRDVVRADGFSYPRTAALGNAALPSFPVPELHLGVPLAIVSIWFVSWLLNRSTFGFASTAVGANPEAAGHVGIDVRRVMIVAMSVSGSLAGLGGATQVLGVIGYYANGVGGSVGFDAIVAALLGGGKAAPTAVAAVLFAAFRTGAPAMEVSSGVAVEIIDIIQGLTIFFLAAPLIVRIGQPTQQLNLPGLRTASKTWRSPRVS